MVKGQLVVFNEILCNRYEPPIDTADDLAKSGLHWLAPQNGWTHPMMDMDPVLSVVQNNFEIHSLEYLADQSRKGTVGLVIEHMEHGYFAFQDYITLDTMDKMRVMKKDIMILPLVYPIVRSWYLKDVLDELILRVDESGIHRKWVLDETFGLVDTTVQKAMKLSTNEGIGDGGRLTDVLRIDRMCGIFYLWVIGLLVALVVFIAEILCSQYLQNI